MLGHLSVHCGLLSAPMTLPGIRLGRVQAGIETPVPSVTLTDSSQWMEPPLGIVLAPHTAACLPTILPARLVAELQLPGVLMT